MLIGKLVRLRPYESSDLDRVLGWVNDHDIAQFMAMRYESSRAQEEEWIAKAAYRTSPPDVVLAIDTLSESRHIGSIGLHQVVHEDRKAVLAIMIGEKDCWNHGYGADAIQTLLRFAFDEINLNRIELLVHDDNPRAIACYRKCGFVEEARLRQDHYKGGAYHDTLVMGLLVDDYRAQYAVELQEAS
jgi:RimJ/RimL family protein N-acetyltransferase